ncbi:polymer-forming cytoskeletal protein [Treponema sp. OMZ 305]|uniref:bactofilin family protein n=1 Tax=Treponema sp. OMZ 305 TaxID=1659192 RepID=UPI0020A4FC0D|nr:polymer-forming cytoskeletal protein [Treponema sp. OMZ 305]UTC57515.1 polymer-forming cytoskeletal protein [Treponema sp. OMZ 305]
MAKKNFIDDISINTIVGSGSMISGNITVSGFLRIDGDINGNIQTMGRVIIGEEARIRGNIRAASVSVGGIVQGDIIAPDYVVVLSSGMVIGSVLTKKLRVDDNVILHGFCSATGDQHSFEEAEKKYSNRQALHSSTFSYSK